MKHTLALLILIIASLNVFASTALAEAPCPQPFMSDECKQYQNERGSLCVNVALSAETRAQCRAAMYQKYSARTQEIVATEGYVVGRRVLDGDTIELETGEKVRLIGVDTSETRDPRKSVEYFGPEATAFTKSMVEGKRVRLEMDQANAHLGHTDKYLRILAYVILEDGTFLNAEIIKEGFGLADTQYPFIYEKEFRLLEEEAINQKRGLWGYGS